jgi:hypothetical protein
MPQIVMIVQIFVPQTQPVHALSNQFFNRVLDPPRIAMINETVSKPSNDSSREFDFSQQQPAAVGCDRSSIESSDYFATSEPLKRQRFFLTLCLHGSASVRV